MLDVVTFVSQSQDTPSSSSISMIWSSSYLNLISATNSNTFTNHLENQTQPNRSFVSAEMSISRTLPIQKHAEACIFFNMANLATSVSRLKGLTLRLSVQSSAASKPFEARLSDISVVTSPHVSVKLEKTQQVHKDGVLY